MPDYQYFSHACQETFSKGLTLAEYEEGEVLCPHCGSDNVEQSCPCSIPSLPKRAPENQARSTAPRVGHYTHTLTIGLSPFPEKTNCHVDHDHYHYHLNQKPNRHFITSLTPLNCRTDR